MKFVSREDPQFKANLHSHTNLSDGNLTPEQSVEAYKAQGYQILALTDHEAPRTHHRFTGEDFLMLTGYEAYIRPSAECKLDRFGPEIHLNLFAKDPDNLTYIAYDPNFCKYMSEEEAQKLPKSRDLGPRRYSPEYIQAFIDCAVENGYLVSYPLDHFLNDSFGSWTMVIAPDLSYGSVISALEQGKFYASTGPKIHDLEISGGKAKLECSAAVRVTMHCSMKYCRNVCNADGSELYSAEFDIPENASYVYFTVWDKQGKRAHTHAFRRGEF